MFKYTTEHNELTVWQKGHHQKRAYAFFIKDSRDIKRERGHWISPLPHWVKTIVNGHTDWPHYNPQRPHRSTQLDAHTHIYKL